MKTKLIPLALAVVALALLVNTFRPSAKAGRDATPAVVIFEITERWVNGRPSDYYVWLAQSSPGAPIIPQNTPAADAMALLRAEGFQLYLHGSRQLWVR